MSPRRIVLIGAGGFVGSHLMRRFQDGPTEFVAVSVREVDLTKDAKPLAHHLDAQTAVVMTAGVKRQWGDTIEAFQQNVSMAVNVARLLQSHPVQRFVYFSSAAVYGEEHHNEAITEETAIRPTSYYGAAKFASECVLQKTLGGAFVALRPPLIYGPGDTSKSYGPSGFVHAVQHGEMVTLWGEGDEKREFVYVLDVVEIVARLVRVDFSGTLNIASGKAWTFRQAADLAGGTIHTKPRSKPKVDHGFNNALLTSLFPDFTFTSLGEGIRQMIQ